MRLLIVEDEPDLANALKQGLEHHGFAVDLAGDGEAGWAHARGFAYDGIVLDRMLPGLDGLALCRRLRAAGSDVGILMLTARDAVPDRVEGLNAGADDYLVKPFAFNELLARVRAVVRRHAPTRTNVLVAHDLTLDLDAGVTQRGGRMIELTRKEMMLLAYMLRHPNQLLSAEQIAEAIWAVEGGASAEVVRSHVKNLRRKIDRDFEPKLIKTMHGMGYKLAG